VKSNECNDLFKKVLLTGATGFVGSNLARRLVAEDWDTHIIVRHNSEMTLLEKIADRLTIYRHDGTTAGMFQIFEKAKPNLVFHLTSLFVANHASNEVVKLMNSNIVFGAQLLEAMSAYSIYCLVNTGTSWQHYQQDEYSPVNLYAATKEAFEAILKFYVETTDLKAITLKLFDTYGRDDPRPKLFKFLRDAAKNQSPLDMSPGKQLIDLVYIDDVVEAYLIAAEHLQNGEVCEHERYDVSSGNPISLREIANLYEKEIKCTLPIKWGAKAYRPREVMAPSYRGVRLPGWQSRVSLSEGIRRMEIESTDTRRQ